MPRIVRVLAAALVVTACGATPIGAPTQTPAGIRPGAAVDPGERPDAAACQAAIRSDIAGALAVRTVLSSPDFGGLPIATDAATARRAAADPASDLVVFGIPVTRDELAASRASGIELDSMLPLTARMQAHTEAYGNRWIEAGSLVVAVTSRNAAAGLRCFEPADRPVRYVAAGWSKSALDAIQDRINSDWQSGALARDGIDVRMTGQTVEDDVFVVQVTVHGLTPAMADELHRRYGDPIVPVEGEGARPA
jgi:hypothetical protein